MRKLAIMALALAMTTAVACDDDNPPAGPSTTGPIIFTAQLSAANEVPPVSNAESTARGTVTVTMNVPRDSAGNPTGGGTANFAIQLNSFPASTPAIVAAHIHPGAAGVNGSPLVNLNVSAAAPIVITNGGANVSINDIAVTQTQATDITANPANFYFNVHSGANPGGVARGQLARQ